jgi:hypothetical protein
MGSSNGCLVRRKRRHGQALVAAPLEDIVRNIAGDAQLPLRLLIVGFEIGISDGPIFERASRHRSVGGAHAEVFLQVAPRLRAVTEGAAAHAGGVVAVGTLTGPDDTFSAIVHQHARVAVFIGTEGVAEHGSSLIAEIVLAAIGGGIPSAALQQHHAKTGGGQFLSHHPASGAGAYDQRVYVF